ncbi:MAG: YicC/YloC family endoribonuclease [Bacteriovoracaceae bacterium]
MNIFSMTGFGKGEARGSNYTVVTELKTVNNRFKDFRFKMSHLFNEVEMELRSTLDGEFRRGSFDINISYKKNEGNKAEFAIDLNKVETYLELMRPVFKKNNIEFQVSPTEFLRSDFAKDEEDLKEKELLPLVRESFAKAVTALKASRDAEGDKLSKKLLDHLKDYETNLLKVDELKSIYPEIVREKLTAKFQEKLKDIKIDESRYLQEVVYYLEKLDVDEELNRAKIHIEKLRKVLKTPGEVGRQIDFLMQELGRETNTLGSKSAQSEISTLVVEMKVQLEKIREQALNLE